MNYILHAIDGRRDRRKALLIMLDDLISIYFCHFGFRLLIIAAERINDEPKCCISNEGREKEYEIDANLLLPI